MYKITCMCMYVLKHDKKVMRGKKGQTIFYVQK